MIQDRPGFTYLRKDVSGQEWWRCVCGVTTNDLELHAGRCQHRRDHLSQAARSELNSAARRLRKNIKRMKSPQ